MLNRTPVKLTTKEKIFGLALGAGASVLTGIGVAVPTMEFIIGGAGGATGFGIAVTGVGAVVTVAAGSLLLAAVGGVAAYIAYKSYAETATSLKKDKENERLNKEIAGEKLTQEIVQYVMAITRLHLLQNPDDENPLQQDASFRALLDQHLPAFSARQRGAIPNIKKLLNQVHGLDVEAQHSVNTVNIVGKLKAGEFKNVMKFLKGEKPANQEEKAGLEAEEAAIKANVTQFYQDNFKPVQPKKAVSRYILDGLLGGLAGFVGVLGTSTSIATVVLGVGLSIGFLATNPIGWGILGAAAVVGLAAGLTYGYFQYKNASRRQKIFASRDEVAQLTEQATGYSAKRIELEKESRLLEGRAQANKKSADAEALASINVKVASLEEEKRKDAEVLAIKNAEVANLNEENRAAKVEIAFLRAELAVAKQGKKESNTARGLEVPTAPRARSASFSHAHGLFSSNSAPKRDRITPVVQTPIVVM